MPLVLDASMAAAWLLKETADPSPIVVIDRLRTDRALVPQLWWFEVRNVLLKAERHDRLGGVSIESLIGALLSLPVDIDPLLDDAPIFALARRHRLTFYDASYLALATRRRLPLATLDTELIAAAEEAGVAIVRSGL